MTIIPRHQPAEALPCKKSGKIIASESYNGVSNLVSFNADGTADALFGPYNAGFVEVGAPDNGGAGGTYVQNIITDSTGKITISLNVIDLYRETFYGNNFFFKK